MLEERWGQGLSEYKKEIDEIVMARVAELRENAEAEAPKANVGKRSGTTPCTLNAGQGKKKARVTENPRKAEDRDEPTSPSSCSPYEAEEARLNDLLKRCKLFRPRNINAVRTQTSMSWQ